MTATFVTTSTLTTAVRNILKFAATTPLPAWWDDLIARAVGAANLDISTRLQARGFSEPVIAAWDRGAEFAQFIAIYYVLIEAATSSELAGVDPRYIDRFDRRGELASVVVSVNGHIQDPGNTQLATVDGAFDPITTGVQGSASDLFSLDTNDPRMGQPTRF